MTHGPGLAPFARPHVAAQTQVEPWLRAILETATDTALAGKCAHARLYAQAFVDRGRQELQELLQWCAGQ